MKKYSVLLSVVVLFTSVFAVARPSYYGRGTASDESKWTWDLGYSLGSYNSYKYQEYNLGLNWKLSDYFTWRNAAFYRTKIDTDEDPTNDVKPVYGLDSSMRLNFTATSDDRTNSFNIYGGPGYRFASNRDTEAAFAEGGIGIKLGPLRVGAGAKYFYRFNPPTDPATGKKLHEDITYTLTVSGGGTL